VEYLSFKGSITTREDGCVVINGMLEGKMISYILCSWELREIGKPIKKNILKYLREHPEKR